MFDIVSLTILTAKYEVMNGLMIWIKRLNRAGCLDWVYYLDNILSPITTLIKCLYSSINYAKLLLVETKYFIKLIMIIILHYIITIKVIY